MNAVLIVAHAPFASALKACALHVFPEAEPWVVALDVWPHESQDDALVRCEAAIETLIDDPDTQGVLMLSDIFGATPCNAATRALHRPNTRLLTGANVPMVLKAVSYRYDPLDAVVMRATAGATQSVMSVSPTIPQNHQKRHTYDHHHRDHQQ